MIRKTFLASVTLCLSGTAAAQTPPPPTATRDPDVADRAYIAATAYHVIKRYFAHAEALPPSYDFEARYRAYLREALAAPDRRGFALDTMRLFASLGNGHTGFDDETLWAQTPDLPFRAKRLEKRWTVTTSRLAVLAPGDVIITVDGKPVDEWLAPVRAEISSAIGLDRLSWTRPFLLPRSFSLGLADGRRVEINRETRAVGPQRGRIPPAATEVVRRSDGVVVIRIPSFEDGKSEDAAIAALRSSATASAVLFDLRGNGGGSTPVKLLAAIMTRPYRGTLVNTPMTIADNDAHAVSDGSVPQLPTVMMRYGPELTTAAADAWSGRAAVLADGGCASACEDFVLRFKDGKRGPVLGETTYGSTGQPYLVSFPEFGMSFRVSTKREYFPDNQQFEGFRVAPDISVPLTRAELKSGTDDQLERAVRIVKQRG